MPTKQNTLTAPTTMSEAPEWLTAYKRHQNEKLKKQTTHLDSKTDNLKNTEMSAKKNLKKKTAKLDFFAVSRCSLTIWKSLLLDFPSLSLIHTRKPRVCSTRLLAYAITKFQWTPSRRNAASAPHLMKAFIIKIPTAKARNDLLSMGPKLKYSHSNDIWQMEDAHNVSISPQTSSSRY